MFFIPLLQWRIFRELFLLFSICLSGLLAIMLIGRGLQLRELFFGLEIGIADSALLFVYLSPLFLFLVIPITCMLSVFLVFLRMSTDRELVALKAGGVSLYQMLPAPVVFSCLCFLITLGISFYATPWGMDAFRTSVLDIAQNKVRISVKPGSFNTLAPNLTIYARQADEKGEALTDVFIEDSRESANVATIYAREGQLNTDKTEVALLFLLKDGSIYRVNKEKIARISFASYTIKLSLANLFEGIDLGVVRPKEMSMEQLQEVMQDSANEFYTRAFVEYQKRFIFPVACLVLGLFAVPLACAFEGVKRQTGMALALLLFCLYYSLLSFVLTLAQGEAIPLIASWGPNVLFALFALMGIRQVANEAHPKDIFKRFSFKKKKQVPL